MNGTVELTLPKSLDINDFEIKMIVASKLYELGKLSAGQAAEVAGVQNAPLSNCSASIMFRFSVTTKKNSKKICKIYERRNNRCRCELSDRFAKHR